MNIKTINIFYVKLLDFENCTCSSITLHSKLYNVFFIYMYNC